MFAYILTIYIVTFAVALWVLYDECRNHDGRR